MAISFLLVFPIFLMIVAILVQYGLMLNARVVVEHAAQVAARAAVTALPDEQTEAVIKAARLSVSPLCPRAKSGIDDEAVATAAALRAVGVEASEAFEARYAFAKAATQVEWTGGNFPYQEGREIEVTVRYRFLLTVPFAAKLISSQMETVAGVEGRFWEVVARTKVQTSHGRKTRADGSGWPR